MQGYIEQTSRFNLPYLPDSAKAFDVVKVYEFLKRNAVPLSSRILDMGAYQSATLWGLHNLGFQNLYGIDLNLQIYDLPYSTEIHYRYADMIATHFPSDSFDVCMALSSIEHTPTRLNRFLTEAARITRPGGLLIITTDFAFEKVSTRSVRLL